MTEQELSEAVESLTKKLGAFRLAQDEHRLHRKPSLFNLERVGASAVCSDYSTGIEGELLSADRTLKFLRKCQDIQDTHLVGVSNLYQSERAASMTLDAALILATEVLELAGLAWALRGAVREAIADKEAE